MNIEKWVEKNKEITLYLTDKKNMPLIIFNTYEGDGKSIYDRMVEIGCSEFNFLMENTVYSVFKEIVKNNKNEIAFIENNRTLTFEELSN